MRRGLLRDVQAKEPEIHLQYLRERRVVVVRGRREKAERVAALLQVVVHGGGLDRDGVRQQTGLGWAKGLAIFATSCICTAVC